MDSVRLTRDELYALVWKTPMRQLAAQYGISDVALAKTCRRLGVPRPGRGYWAQIAAGMKPRRPSLPRQTPKQDEFVFLRKVDLPPSGPQEPKPKAPTVPVRDTLRGTHQAVQALGLALEDADPDEHGRLAVPSSGGGVFVVTLAMHRCR